MIPPTPWAEDDDDGTLDVNDNAALRARIQKANEADAVTPSPSRTQLTIRSRPLEVPVGSEQQVEDLPAQVDTVQRPETPNTDASPASPNTRTNANGIPILDESRTAAEHGGMDPSLWNAFASNVYASAGSYAAALLQRLQSSSKGTSAPERKLKKRPK